MVGIHADGLDTTMLIKEYMTIPALTGDEERRAYYYLPDDYDFSGERYPVLYMFDGHNLFLDEDAAFGKCWGLKDYLDATGKKIIVAAVECNHVGNGRLSEYSPVSFDFNGAHIVGRGKKYMDWLTGVFKPMVDEKLRTLPDREHTYIAGSSMGGLMSLYALARYNGVFSRAAALSPSLWVQDGELPKFLQTAKFRAGTSVFMHYGTREFKNHSSQAELFYRALRLIAEKGATVTSKVTQGGVHSESSWEKEIPHFFAALQI